MDRTRLVEALELFDESMRTMVSGVGDWKLIGDAVRAVLDAPTVQWCATHNSEPAHAFMSDRCERITVALVPVEDNQ